MVSRRRRGLALGIAFIGMLGGTRRVEAHPLHSTLTELALDPARGTVRGTIRVFADDLRSAVNQVWWSANSDAAITYRQRIGSRARSSEVNIAAPSPASLAAACASAGRSGGT